VRIAGSTVRAIAAAIRATKNPASSSCSAAMTLSVAGSSAQKGSRRSATPAPSVPATRKMTVADISSSVARVWASRASYSLAASRRSVLHRDGAPRGCRHADGGYIRAARHLGGAGSALLRV
jgi:hypothetical protein